MSAPLKKPPAGARLHHTYRGHRRDSFVPLDEAEQIELRARQRTFDGAWQRTALGTLGYGAVVLKVFDRRFFAIGALYVAVSFLLVIVAWFRARKSNHSFSDLYPERWDGEEFPAPHEEALEEAGLVEEPRSISIPVLAAEEQEVAQQARPLGGECTNTSEPPISPPAQSHETSRPTLRARPSAASRRSDNNNEEDVEAAPPPPSPSVTPQPAPAVPAPPRLPSKKRIFGAPFVPAGPWVVLFSALVGGMEIALFVLVMKL